MNLDDTTVDDLLDRFFALGEVTRIVFAVTFADKGRYGFGGNLNSVDSLKSQIYSIGDSVAGLNWRSANVDDIIIDELLLELFSLGAVTRIDLTVTCTGWYGFEVQLGEGTDHIAALKREVHAMGVRAAGENWLER